MNSAAIENFVGPYRILRLINRGGQGSVFLGYDKRLHRRVAIKIYDMPSQREARESLLREAQLVASVETPKVVQVYDVIESESHLALIMEYVPGCTLEELLQNFSPSLASLVTLGTDVAGALAVARQQQIVHGDLKAANVLITPAGHAKLTDFGIARRSLDVQAQPWTAGSLSALSPEQYRGELVDGQTDLFALGLLLYRMLCGEHPFYCNGQLDVERLLTGEMPPLEERVPADMELPPQVPELIARLLHKDPLQRPGNTRGIRQVLREVSRGIPMSASNSLLLEARPYFRPESPEDIPPRVPQELAHSGRSRMTQYGPWARPWYWFAGLRRTYRGALLLLALAVTALLLWFAASSRIVTVAFSEPVTLFTEPLQLTLELPQEVSRKWLVGQVKQALVEHLGELRVIGTVGAEPVKTLRSNNVALSRPDRAEHEFQIELRCSDAFCALSVTVQNRRGRVVRQAMLFPGMSLQQWQDAVRSTTLALYN